MKQKCALHFSSVVFGWHFLFLLQKRHGHKMNNGFFTIVGTEHSLFLPFSMHDASQNWWPKCLKMSFIFILIGDNWKLSSIMRKNGMWQAYNIDWLPNNYNQWWQIAQKTIFQCADCPPKGLSFLHRQYSLLIGTRYPSSHNVAHNNMSIKIKKNMFHPIINRFTRTHIHT